VKNCESQSFKAHCVAAVLPVYIQRINNCRKCAD